MEIATKKLSRFFLVLGLVAFLWAAFFGMSQTMVMEKQSDGMMSGCLFVGKVAVCAMSFINHLSQWQGMLTATSSKINALIILAYLSALAVIIFASPRSWAVVASETLVLSKFYAQRIFHAPIFNFLKEAFSQGILHPKIYEFAIL